MNREASYAALFNFLQMNVVGITTWTRFLRHWTDVPQDEMPYLCMAQGKQIPNSAKGKPTSWMFHGTFHLYIWTDASYSDPSMVLPATIMNNLLDSIEQVLTPDNVMQSITLGTTFISHIKFEGDIETDDGWLGQKAVALVPFAMNVAP